jgi:hypothetical protein
VGPRRAAPAYVQTFDDAASLTGFEFSNPATWQFSEKGNGTGALEFLGPGGYRPPVRSPVVVGLISGRTFGDFVLDVDMLQTGKEYGHRDMCIFFNFIDPSHFYYVHIASRADPHAHNIFLVDGKPRTAIATKTTKGIDWGKNVWHKVRLERTLADGGIRVYFDDMTAPLMEAKDTTFGAGMLGFGSFDDTGMVDNVKIWSPKAGKTETSFFKKK